MLNDLLNNYHNTLLEYTKTGFDVYNEPKIKDLLEEIFVELSHGEWKSNPHEIISKYALYATYDMFQLKIGGDTSALLCYYFCTLDINTNNDSNINGYRHRADIVFRNINKWDDLIYYARTTKYGNYKGELNGDEFVDFLLLSDVYKAWEYDNEDSTFANLKRQTPKVEALHPSFTKNEIMNEGNLAHEAMFNYIKMLLFDT